MKFVLIGAGQRGMIYAKYAYKKGHEIAAVAETDPVKREIAANEFGIPAERRFESGPVLLSEPRMGEAAIIATMDRDHYNEAIPAMEKGYHLLLEKPIAKSIALAREIASLDDGTVVMGVAENWLYRNCVGTIRELLDAGTIGTVKEFQIYSLYQMDLESEYLKGNAWRKKTEGGMILDRTVHAVSMMRGLFGEVRRVTGLVSSLRPELGEVDTMNALLEYENGIHGAIINSASVPNLTLPYGVIIVGEKGSVCCADFHSKIIVIREDGQKIHPVDNEDQGYRAEFLDFYHAVSEGTAFRSTFRGAYNDLFACMAPLERPGEWVDFDQVED